MSDGDRELQEMPITKTNPDPSIATNDAVERAVTAERDYVDGQLDVLRERLAGIDTATELRMNGIQDVPVQIAAAIVHLRGLMDEKFASIQMQFEERDTRSERESRDNAIKVDAAFSAQKEAAAKQDEANAKAIDKSEKATAETLKTLADLFRTTTDALSDKHDDLKERVGKIESVKQGGVDQRRESQLSGTFLIGIITVAVAIIGVVIVVANLLTATPK